MSGTTGVIGIDLGSSRFIVAGAKRGNVDVLVNEANYRHSPCLVTYGAERAAGDSANNKVKKELRNSVHMPLRLLGDVSDARLEREGFFAFAQLRREGAGGLRLHVQAGRDAVELAPEQAVAALFTKARQILAMNDSGCSTLVVAVPATFGPAERQAVLDAARIAGLEVALLVNETSAAVLSYGIFRKAELDAQKPRTVVFADVGHSKTTIFAARLLQDSAEVFFERSDCDLGVRELDRLMFSFYAEKVLERLGRSVADFPKAKLRLLEAIERQRKVLSANTEAGLSLDCLVDEQDFSFALSREQYLQVCAPVFDRFQQFFLRAREEMGEIGELHSVERIGGGSRIPLVERLLAVAFGVEGVGKTLDASECVARGAAIRAAMISPLFRVANFAIKDRLGLELRARFRYESDAAAKDAALFPRGSEAGKVLSVGLSKDERLSYQVYCVRDGQERVLLSGEVERASPRTERCEAKLFFALDSSLVVRADRAEVRETLPGEPDETGARRDRVETRQLALSAQTHFGLPAQALAAFRDAENRFVEEEKALAATRDAKYALEAFVYDTRGHIESADELASPAEKSRMFAALDEAQNWLYAEGEEAAGPALNQRLEALKGECRAFLCRREVLGELVHYLPDTRGQLQKLTTHGEQLAAEVRSTFDQALQGVEQQLQRLDVLLQGRNPAQLDATDFGEAKRAVSTSFSEAEKALKKASKASQKLQTKEEPSKMEEEKAES